MKKIVLSLAVAIVATCATAQTVATGYTFTDTKTVPATSVKNQASSGTCWSFSGLAFLESEILTAGGPGVDLSAMFVVRHAYHDRAVKYVRMHGTSSLSAGAAAEDVFICWREHGIVPTEVYDGLSYGQDIHRHAELDAVIRGYCDAVIRNPNRKLSTAWLEGLDAILDAYLGALPETFTWQGREYTPRSFADSLSVDIDDYVSLTSFTHHPFDEWFVVEVPDNTVWGESFNVPLAEMMSVMEATVNAGYPVLWASDVSEQGFAWRKGLAVVPEADLARMDDSELARWVALSQAEQDAALYRLDAPGVEKTITQELRQEAFDNWETTDDHGMEIIGTATDQEEGKYFKVKNSWGADQHIYDGYFYASRPFVAYKTISVMVNRNTLPRDLRRRMEQ
ncbi:MAG: C1 family peptidase [Alistipes sp.]|jgi:bleomycin hydrolase|nr:C1 family peptidase [Alistipes sp.]